MEGIVIKSTGSWYLVKDTNTDLVFQCRIRGKFRLPDYKSTNPLAVGDRVDFTLEQDNKGNEYGIIGKLHIRNNYIVRKSNKLSSQFQIIASNIDLVMPVFTFTTPTTSQGFLDRILITAEAYHIPALIIFNKVDILTDEELAQLKIFESLYNSIGYQTIKIDALQGENIFKLKHLIQGKASLICGHSGAGKSTIINRLNPELNIKTNHLSEKYLKGKHTTTFAEMHILDSDTSIIDTPGIRDFGIIDINKQELGQYYPEFRTIASQCKFKDCLHINEPECAIIQAVDKGEIDSGRYNGYIGIIHGENIFE
ncbi:MAG: ribosome small subunit-dependent GTPase A [Bacteroidia bacterium]|nr:ribosome small subunit-dependent GTPase A [Bacteroidia bacterium]MCO5254777.1 ribosome small subunit-dependent GTPase A [Bacteroidota bacterium]